MSDRRKALLPTRAAVAAAGFIVLFASLSLTAALHNSLTFDEPLHLYAGYSYLHWADFRVNPEHPPLVKTLAALSFIGPDIETAGITPAERASVFEHEGNGWQLAARFIAANRDNQRLFWHPKVVVVALAGVLAAMVFFWARELYGWPAAVAAIALYCMDPNILAHSSIVHTDLPFTLFFFAGTYFFWRTLNRATWANLALTSVWFAFAAVTKFSFVSIMPLWVILGALRVCSPQPQFSVISRPGIMIRTAQKATLLLVVLVAAVIAGYAAIWAAYGFRFDAVGLGTGQMPVGRLLSEENWLTPLVFFNAKYFSLPEAWVYGVAYVFSEFERPSYLLGELAPGGQWSYFPVAFLVKTPLPTLLMIVIALVITIRRARLTLSELFLLVPSVGFFCSAAASPLNIGLRHILPVYPFIFVWLGGAAAAVWAGKSRMARCAIVALTIWLVGSSVKTYPHYLAFFNELAGGPTGGHRFLLDSNLDWGQDLRGLKTWMDERDVKTIAIAYFGTVNPSAYGIDAIPAPGSLFESTDNRWSDASVAPYIAISATYLAGLYLPRPELYARFRERTPVASIGHSILLFHNQE